MALAANTITPRPPLNIFEASRKNLSNPAIWTELVTVPRYYIPLNGPVEAKFVNTAAIVTGLIITNTTTGPAVSIKASARIIGTDSIAYPIIANTAIPPNDFLTITFERQVLLSGEKLEVIASGAATAHFTYIVNQREDFEVRVA
jgi:hypothetical protein